MRKVDQQDGGYAPQQDNSMTKRNMMDPEAQKMRVAYERVHSLRMSPDKGNNACTAAEFL